jgi:SAM-dependent methyltransferase
MRFGRLKRHWGRLGRRDPYWAVLTDPDKRGGRWDVTEFFRRGQLEIDAVLHRAQETGMAPASYRRALDFGCGAGRLTQAMAAHFSQCDGVDISKPMLRIARQHNRFPDRCTYHLNARPDLSLFADDSFDFVYSTLVLQHMAPRYSTRYIHELVRVLAPGGLLVFQLPSQRSTQEPPTEARQTRIHGRLPDDACRAALTTDVPSLSAGAGADVTIEVTAENRSPHPWPSLPDALGRYQINVANHWLDENGEVLQRDDGRCPLPWDVAPGARASAMLIMTAPAEDGVYQLELDLVQEDVGWFGDRGSPTLRVPVMVGKGRDAPKRPPPVVPEAPPTFRTTHPRAFHALSAIGVRDAYWSYRRGLDHVRRARDAAIVGIRDGLKLPRLMNWLRRRDFMTGRMEMHWVPRAEVVSIVTAAGGRVTEVIEEWTPGYQSCRYWIRKD